MVHDQDLHTSTHESFELAVQVVMNDASLVIELGYLQLREPVQLLDQVLELFMRDDLFLLRREFRQIHFCFVSRIQVGYVHETGFGLHVMDGTYLLERVL